MVFDLSHSFLTFSFQPPFPCVVSTERLQARLDLYPILTFVGRASADYNLYSPALPFVAPY